MNSVLQSPSPEAEPSLAPGEVSRLPRRGGLLLGCSSAPGLPGAWGVGHVARAVARARPGVGVLALATGAGQPRGSSSGDVAWLTSDDEAAAWLASGRVVIAAPGSLGDEADWLSLHGERLTGLASRSGAALAVAGCRDQGERLDVLVSSHVLPGAADERAARACPRELLRLHERALSARPSGGGPVREVHACPLAEAMAPERLLADLRGLPSGAKVASLGSLDAYVVRAAEAPHVVLEIGRLRELTFREAGEGTGNPIDLDDYDDHYHHLFVFDREASAIAGAYRIGVSGELLASGPSGLYTSTLFEFEPELFDALGPALELGRSFVAPRYQRASRTLMLLWRAIGSFVAARPRYRHLFGPVSVSAEYSEFSRELIARVLGGERYRHPLASMVRPRTPAARHFGDGGLGDPARMLLGPEELSSVVSSAEADAKGLPVLVWEYLKLGGRFLDFNVDPAFSDVLDGLVVVDLDRTDPRLLGFYMGKEVAERFRGAQAAAARPG